MSQVIQSKIKSLLSIPVNSQEMQEALDSLAVFYDKGDQGKQMSTTDARRELRSDLEKQSFMLAESFLNAFEDLQRKLSAVQSDVNALDERSSAIRKRIYQTNEESSRFVSRIHDLLQRKEGMQARYQQVTTFLESFQLSDSQIEALNNGEINVGTEFFAAVERARAVREKCQQLLSSGQHAAGLELLEKTAQQQEMGYQRLYQWIQDFCLSPGNVDLTDRSQLLQAVLTELRHRPHYFVHAQESIIGARCSQVVKRFIYALTRGDRPIDLHAHDPMRYAGDMLAWIHQAIAAEKELLSTLFENTETAAVKEEVILSPPTSPTGSSISAKPKKLEDCLATIFDAVAKPLHGRLSQIIQQHTGGIVLAYKLSHLMAFYSATINSLVARRSGFDGAKRGEQEQETDSQVHTLCSAINDCRQTARKTFESAIEIHMSKISHSLPAYPVDLSASPSTVETASILSDLIQVYENSLVEETEPECQISSQVFDRIIQPVLDVAKKSAESGMEWNTSDKAVYMLNNIYVLYEHLRRHDFVSKWATSLKQQKEEWMQTLVQDQVNRVFLQCGISETLAKLKDTSDTSPAATRPGLGPETIGMQIRAFYNVLFALFLPQFDRLRDSVSRQEGPVQAAEILAQAHDTIHAAIHDPRNGYPEPNSLAIHTPAQVRTLLNLD